MTKLIYYFALAIASITFVINVFSNNGIFNGFVRSAIVFLGILFIMSISAHIMKGILKLNNSKPKKSKKKKTEGQNSSEEESDEEETEGDEQ